MGSSGSSGIAGFTEVRPWVRRVQPGALGSQGCALGAVGGRWVHFGAPWGPSCSSRVAGATGERPGGLRVHPGSLGSVECAFAVVVFIRGRWVQWDTPWRSSYSFIWGRCVHWCSPWGPSGSFGVAGFTEVRPGCRRVHPG